MMLTHTDLENSPGKPVLVLYNHNYKLMSRDDAGGLVLEEYLENWDSNLVSRGKTGSVLMKLQGDMMEATPQNPGYHLPTEE